MKNFLAKCLLALVLVFGVVGAIEGPALACTSCTCNVNPAYPIGPYCLSYSPGLVQNAFWCNNGQTPSAHQVIVYAATSWNQSPYCMVINTAQNTAGGTQVNNLEYYGWDGPSFQIKSIWFGSLAQGWVYTDNNLSGNSTRFNVGTYSSDTTSLSISSFIFYWVN